jgi:hypothetical protein
MVVGLLERAGIRIDYSLNILSSMGFALMLIMIYILGKNIFGRRLIGLYAVILTLFNGSLSFLRFFNVHPLSASTPIDILTNTTFPSFGPWDGSIVSAFWNMNIFTNQRHLGLSYAMILVLIYMIIRAKPHVWKQISFPFIHSELVIHAPSFNTSVGIACIISTLFFLNQAGLAIIGILSVWMFLLAPSIRGTLIVAAALTLPAYFLWTKITASSGLPVWNPGYLMVQPITIYSFMYYWWMNLGAHVFCIPIGMSLAPRTAKKIFIVPMVLLFGIGNLYRLSPDIINNHKFFNFFIILGTLFSATVLAKITDYIHGIKADSTILVPSPTHADVTVTSKITFARSLRIWRIGAALFGIGLFGILTLSGIIDLPPIGNDHFYTVEDRNNSDVNAFLSLTHPNDTILNSTFFYHPASLAGRPLFFGYSYFTWSYGYDQTAREQVFLHLWRESDKTTACTMLVSNHIQFIALSDYPESYIQPHIGFWNNEFTRIYRNDRSGLSIFDVRKSCN